MSLQSRLSIGCKMMSQLWNLYCMFVRMNITHRAKFTCDYQTNASLLKPHAEFHYSLHTPLPISARPKQGVWNYTEVIPLSVTET